MPGKGKKACSTPCFNPLLFVLNPLLAAGLVATLGLGLEILVVVGQ
jgi:hypothetical protein